MFKIALLLFVSMLALIKAAPVADPQLGYDPFLHGAAFPHDHHFVHERHFSHQNIAAPIHTVGVPLIHQPYVAAYQQPVVTYPGYAGAVYYG